MLSTMRLVPKGSDDRETCERALAGLIPRLAATVAAMDDVTRYGRYLAAHGKGEE